MLKSVLVAMLTAAALHAANMRIPTANGPMTLDGRMDEEIWTKAAVLPLEPTDFGAPFPAGGEMRAVVRGGYLCLGARVPETGRVVARSVGRNPAFWREDMVVWTVHFKGYAVALKVAVTPLGAYRVDTERLSEGTEAPPILVRAEKHAGGWGAEVAIPLSRIAAVGFLSAERIRVPRPDAPELRWYWPGLNDRLAFELTTAAGEAPGVATEERPILLPGALPKPSFPYQVLPESEHPDQMWEKQLRARVREAALAERREWRKVETALEWEKFRAPRLAALKASLGTFPSRTPLHAEVTRRADYGDGFAIENVLFESRPGLVVTANLYLPSKIAGQIPAVVVVHSHHAPKTHAELQDLGMTWARGGTAVLIMDQLGAGERVQSQAWPRESYYSRYALGMQLYLAGDSLMKWIVWDLMRGIDMLLERPYVDPKRIVMLGAVAAGGDPAAVMAALDSRIAIVFPFNFGEASPEQHYTAGPRQYDAETADPGWGSWESTRNLRGSISGQFFPWFICAAGAPRPFVFSFEMGWPNGVEKEPIWARYKKVYGLSGAYNHLDQVHGFGPFTGPGEVTDVGVYHRKQIDRVLNRLLMVPVPEQEYHNPRPEADLMCLTPKAAAERRPKAASEIAYVMAQERLSLAHGDLRERLRGKLGDIEPNAKAPARVVWTKDAAEGIALETSPGITVPMVVVKPMAARFPVVLALAQGGKEAFLKSRNVRKLVEQGVGVCMADVRGTGETGRAGGTTSLAATELMLGGTAMGGRLKDARTVLRYLAGRPDVDAKRLAVWGESFAGVNAKDMWYDQSVNQQPGPVEIAISDPLGAILATLTALYEPGVRAIAAQGGLESYLSVLGDRFCYVPQDVIVPGILHAADLPEIQKALAPRPALFTAQVDGRNRRVSPDEKAPDAAEWIAAQLLR